MHRPQPLRLLCLLLLLTLSATASGQQEAKPTKPRRVTVMLADHNPVVGTLIGSDADMLLVKVGDDVRKIALDDVTMIIFAPVKRAIRPARVQPAQPAQPAASVTPRAPSTSSDDYYTNSRGERVRRPVKSNTAPAGATARCRDGSYSFSRSRRGTCSYHGGVAVWL